METFARQPDLPIVQFESGVRKDDVAAEQRKRLTRPEGVVFIGVAQDKAIALKAQRRATKSQFVGFDWSRQSVRVTHYYFYLQDADWVPAFIQVGTYAPYPV